MLDDQIEAGKHQLPRGVVTKGNVLQFDLVPEGERSHFMYLLFICWPKDTGRQKSCLIVNQVQRSQVEADQRCTGEELLKSWQQPIGRNRVKDHKRKGLANILQRKEKINYEQQDRAECDTLKRVTWHHSDGISDPLVPG